MGMSFSLREPRGGLGADPSMLAAAVEAASSAIERGEGAGLSAIQLLERLPIDPGARELIACRVQVTYAHPASAIAADAVRDLAHLFAPSEARRVAGGNQLLAVRLANDHDVRLSTPARVVAVVEGGLRVNGELDVDGLVVATPAPAVAGIDVLGRVRPLVGVAHVQAVHLVEVDVLELAPRARARCVPRSAARAMILSSTSVTLLTKVTSRPGPLEVAADRCRTPTAVRPWPTCGTSYTVGPHTYIDTLARLARRQLDGVAQQGVADADHGGSRVAVSRRANRRIRAARRPSTGCLRARPIAPMPSPRLGVIDTWAPPERVAARSARIASRCGARRGFLRVHHDVDVHHRPAGVGDARHDVAQERERRRVAVGVVGRREQRAEVGQAGRAEQRVGHRVRTPRRRRSDRPEPRPSIVTPPSTSRRASSSLNGWTSYPSPTRDSRRLEQGGGDHRGRRDR